MQGVRLPPALPAAHRGRYQVLALLTFGLIAAAYLGLFAHNSLVQTRSFSPDSMNYVDVARNILAGRGVVQSTLGFNQPHFSPDQDFPVPLTAQPPLYPLAIALIGLTGVALPDSALLVAVGGYGLILLAACALAGELYDRRVALLTAAALMFYAPLVGVSRHAWSEPLGIALVLLCLVLLVRWRDRGNGAGWLPFAAGVSAGLAFATRYALAPVAVVSLCLLLDRSDWRRTARAAGLFAVGAALPAAPVVARNLSLTGALLGPSPNPSTVGLAYNVGAAFVAVAGGYAPDLVPGLQVFWLVVVLLICVGALAVRQQLGAALGPALWSGGRFAPWLWAVGYLGLLVYQRTQTHFDAIDFRLIAPAGVALVIPAAALFSATAGRLSRYLPVLALVIACLAVRREATLEVPPGSGPQALEQAMRPASRLGWISANTTERDLIIGDDTMDVPFYLDRSGSVSFSPYPYTDYLDYPKMMAYVERQRGRYDRFFLVIRERRPGGTDWRKTFGPFVADIMSGQLTAYPGVVVDRRLDDARVFQVIPQGGSG